MSDFDAVVVGAGLAGLTAAYTLAKAGREVVVIERGNQAGAKNMTGGRIYTHALDAILPGFAEEAPLQRRITRERISMVTAEGATTLDYTSRQLADAGRDSYSVLRAVFDPWLAEQAEAAGATILYGVRVDDVIRRDGRVAGVVSGEDEIEADVTIVAEGANSLLTQKIGHAGAPRPSDYAVGVKALYEVPAATIEDRFGCEAGEGAAWLFMGDPTKGRVGGGFLYTNRDSISIGLVATLSDLVQGDVPVYQMLEDFTAHPAIAPLLRGGQLVEYSGHLIPEGGRVAVPRLVGDGVLVAGDAAGLCLNVGYVVRGMDLAITSGHLAAQAAVAALEKNDVSAAGLASYQAALEDSYVLQDLATFSRFPHFMESTPGLFGAYPRLADEVLLGLFKIDGRPMTPVRRQLWPKLRRVGLRRLVRDGFQGVRAL
jgi:electron transfer flavoprotein-quinone oxidoreductase